jgi:hypothetical protein
MRSEDAMIKGIGISGAQRSGKDTLAAALMNDSNYVRIGFADELKKLATRLTGIDMFEESNKIKHRAFLISLGQTMRLHDPLYWVKAAQTEMEKLQDVGLIPLVTDLRFVNECKALKEMNFFLIRLDCNEETLLQRGWDPKYKNDPSEAELNDYTGFDARLQSDRWSPRDLAHQVNLLMEQYNGKRSTPTQTN